MRLLPLVFLLVPVVAQAGELPPDPMVQLLIRGQSAPLDAGDAFLFGASEMRLGDGAARLGADVQDYGRGDYSFACSHEEGRAIWLLSDASDAEGEALVTAVVATPTPGRAVDCNSVEELPQAPADTNAPGVGAGLAEIEDYFAEAIAALEARHQPFEVSEEGLAAFRSHDVMGDGGDSWEVIKTVTYHLSDDVVDAVAYEVVTVR